MQHRECEAWVECAGVRSEVHGATVDGRKISGWIVSEPGQKFSIHVRYLARKSHITARFLLDGVSGGRNTGSSVGDTLSRATFRTGPTTARPYEFARIVSTDDEALAAPGGAGLAALGTIRVEVERVVVLGRRSCSPVGRRDASQLEQRVLHETDKKLGGQSISLGAEQRVTSKAHRTQTRPYNANDAGVWVEFEFRYRSKEFLQAHDIIPKAQNTTPKPRRQRRVAEPADDDDDVQILDERPKKRIKADSAAPDAARHAEISALKARLQLLEAQEGVDVKRVKVEPYRSPFKKGEVFDLTLD